MATYSKVANGRPNLPTSYSHHGYGPSTNQMPSSSYEGYLFVPSEHSSPEDRWTSAQPIKILVSQHDLFNEILKQQKSGKTALEDFCGPRVNDAMRGMINKLIDEKTNSESGSTYTLAAINIDRDYVSDEEPDFGKRSLKDHESEKKDLKKQSKKTTPMLIVLQGSANHYRNGVPMDLSQSFNPNPAANTTGSIRPAASNLMSWTLSNGTPLFPLPSTNSDSNANGSDQSSTPQQVYQPSDGTRTERSASVTSFDTASSSSLFTPTSATSNKDCFIAVDHASNHKGSEVLTPLSAYAWSGISTPIESTKEGILAENTPKQQPLKVQQQLTEATNSFRPLVTSSSTQTDISITDPCEDGRREILNILRKGNGEMGTPSTAKHGPESEIVLSQSTREDHITSTKDLTHDGDSPLPSQVPRSRSPDVLERKPSWMDNMVPVIPSPAEMEPIETVLEETMAESSVTEDCNPEPTKKDTEHRNATKSYQTEHQETSYRHHKCDESLAALPRPATEGIQASVINAEAKPSKKKDTEHQNARKSYQLEHQETSYRRPRCDEALAALAKLAAEGIQASGNNAEANGRKSLRPQYNKKAEYIDSLSATSAKGAANEARDHPPPLTRPVSYNERYIPPSLSKPASDEARYPPLSLGRPRSYERLRPTDHTSQQSHQPIKSQERYNDSKYGTTDTESSHISTSGRVSSLGKSGSFERPRYDPPPIASVSQPAGIRKIYKVKTYDEPDKAPNKHVKFSQPLASSSSVIACNGSDITCPDSPPSSPRTILTGEPIGSPRTPSRATGRPSLPRQSSYIPAHSSDARASHHSSSKNNSNNQSSTSARREVKSSDRKRDKGNDSYNNRKHDDDSDREEKITKTVWRCPYKQCDRRNGRQFATHEEMEEHKYIAHKKDITGRK